METQRKRPRMVQNEARSALLALASLSCIGLACSDVTPTQFFVVGSDSGNMLHLQTTS